MGNEKAKKRTGRIADAVLFAGLFLFAFYVNRDIVIKGLYMDDLYMWSCYGEQSLMEFAFPIGTSTRFRPVYWLATYLQMAIVGNHVNRFVPFNIICNALVAWVLYLIVKRIAGFRSLGFLSGLCYLASRFSYYQIGQALGLMETMALVMAITVLYLLYEWLNTENERTKAELIAEGEAVMASEAEEKSRETRSILAALSGGEAASEPKSGKRLSVKLLRSREWLFHAALFLYFLVVFVHERYIALLPLFYIVLFCKLLRHKKGGRKAYFTENLRLFIRPLLVFFVIMLIRTVCIGTAIPAGTGGTEVTDTFRISEAIGYALSQAAYIFGINAGPEHLCGLPWEASPAYIKTLTKLSLLPLFAVCVLYGAGLLRSFFGKKGEERSLFWKELCNVLLFLSFIALCIGCSSVTIRVEMRWIYVSYTAALIFCSYMISSVFRGYRRSCAEAYEAETGEAVIASEEKAKSREACSGLSALADRTAALLLKPALVRGLLIAVFSIYTLLSVGTNVFYRGYFPKLYFWPDQLRMNSLAEETYERYGDALFGKNVYIIENTYGMSEFYGETFFKPFDKEKTAGGTVIRFAEELSQIPKEELLSGQAIVLREVPEENAYKNITDELLREAAEAN